VDVVTRVRGSAAVLFTVRFAPPLRTDVQPFEMVALTVAPSLPADTVTVTQTTGPAVVIGGSGLDRWATAPGTPGGALLVFRATATRAGTPDAVMDYSVNVAAHGGYFRRDGSAVHLY
jgi:hypothetical protein